MKVLVTAASKHGSTAAIAETIGAVLAARGVDVDVAPVEEVTSVDAYGAVVLGSAVYGGHWMKQALELAGRLGERPVWLFSSGPIGDPPKPDEDPVDVAGVLERTRALEHRVFAGRLDRNELGFAERAIVAALRAPEGDFRDWDAIKAWASEIADALAVAA